MTKKPLFSFKQFYRNRFPPSLDQVFISEDGETAELLEEGTWTKGRFDKSIRIDRATHLQSGEQHAHVYGRKGELVGVLHFDGSKSHGGDSFKLHDKDAEALRAKGFSIPGDNIIEWVLAGVMPAVQFLSE